MLLIGVFSIAFLWVSPAAAEPISIALLTALAIELTATAVAATTFALTFIATTALSYAASALLKPSGSSPPKLQSSGMSRQTIENKISVRQAAAALPQLYGRARLGGTIFFAHAVENDQRLLMAVALVGHECEAIDEIWINDEIVALDGEGAPTSGKYVGHMLIRKHLGGVDQEADAALIARAPDVWTAEHRARGVCYLALELVANPEIFPSLPNVSAVVRGKNDIYDPRDASTGYSANAALCFANYLCDTDYGRSVDFATGIDEPALIAAANACDETVALAAGGSESRYEVNGALLSSLEPQEIMGRLLGAMHGRAPYDGERWKIIAGVWQEPTVTLTDAELRGGPRIATLTSRRDACNVVKGTYMGPDNNWQVADFPPIASATYRALDGDLELVKDIELPLTTSAAMAQRIAKIDLLRARQQIVATMPCKLSAWRVQAGDTVAWTSERYGWSGKEFEVASTRFELYQDESGAPCLGISLELRETASEIYDWGTDEESPVDPAPNTDLPDPFVVLPPTNLTVDETIYATRDGAGVKARADLAWAASVDGFAELYQPEFRLWPSGDWIKLPRFAGVSTSLNDLAPATYEFRVACVNALGVLSPYASAIKDITGLQAPPAAPTGLSLFASGGWGLLRWVQSSELDVRIGGILAVRWSPTEAAYYLGQGADLFGQGADLFGLVDQAASWETASSLIDAVPGADTHAIVPLRTGTYLAKFRDSSGTWSDDAAVVEALQSSAGWTLLDDIVEDPAFAGSKTDCAVSGGELVLDAGEASGLYEFATAMNLGAVYFVRLTAEVVAAVVNNSALVDSSELVDSAEKWDETVSGGEADSWIECRTTTDDPSGAPVWSAWSQLESAEVEAWGVQFRYVMVSHDTDYGIETSGLAVYAEERV